MRLPSDTRLVDLTPHHDHRGTFIEIFRKAWAPSFEAVQWNVVSSEKGVLRGVHVHLRHDDYLSVVQGRAAIGLRDLRHGSPTEGLTSTVELANGRSAIVIPHGVAHGFLFLEPSVHIYAVTHYWDETDELSCRWDDPELGIAWPDHPAIVSPRDWAAPSFSELVGRLRSAGA